MFIRNSDLTGRLRFIWSRSLKYNIKHSLLTEENHVKTVLSPCASPTPVPQVLYCFCFTECEPRPRHMADSPWDPWAVLGPEPRSACLPVPGSSTQRGGHVATWMWLMVRNLSLPLFVQESGRSKPSVPIKAAVGAGKPEQRVPIRMFFSRGDNRIIGILLASRKNDE